ncbi:sensor histidine kinase [Tuwongella immobilis]|uniref:histidine kinase n=1 Tax=Tuwongella immobilis TaxID=692036 RepID=A0A6C2YPT0_9BACT|nr:HAMP domain-containing sensor histidine kinase [Tuwongella immobilis]VIP03321.1 integral membrane sensor signal transduction histidine kinase : Histidine kinase OS=Singulisphaera acidiphila (strain ATCC BAA-1392 / DSM 18658 / VKM B-2454 / MOB10) GN=Sinac_3191 PE=4 SV=1: HAMP: HisKA: HATPase_c [Tuwongella immobilis]VTS04013.1 integral membrane sensor signal transduction histidine kinase : Histidine kinase OS=Singulisphaera acidiphila (strain ATCC BAA-1392 / DSM 18658 / VKM B-2454 / MOB10) GN=Si
MARHWRLRHKLLVGLGLVIASIGLLLVGTIHGLTSYVGTMNTTDSKLVELVWSERLRIAISNLGSPIRRDTHELPDHRTASEIATLRDRLNEAKGVFTGYRDQFQETLKRKRDPDPFVETCLLDEFQKAFDAFDQGLTDSGQLQIVEETAPLIDDPKLAKPRQKLRQLADELPSEIVRDMYQRIDLARTHYRRSQLIVWIAIALALILSLTLIYLFKGWVFQPIKELQAGVKRVAAGNFNQPIVLHGRDELQELGNAFNEMVVQLRAIYGDLASQVNERSRQLVRSERMVSVGFLAAGVAHEINNPLASIAFCSESLERRLTDVLANSNSPETDTIRKYVRMIQTEAFRCKEITKRLLEFSRTGGETTREPTILSELILGVLEITQHLQNFRGKQILFHPLAHVNAMVNAQDLKSVVLNLVVNALDSMDDGGVLTITLGVRGDQAEMTFTDTGCGMPSEVLENIFEPFFTRNRTGKGTGLGLFISHQIIDQHGGVLEAHSGGPGKGSTFIVRVPIRPAVPNTPNPTLSLEQQLARAGQPNQPDPRSVSPTRVESTPETQPGSPTVPFRRPVMVPGISTQTEDGRGHAA